MVQDASRHRPFRDVPRWNHPTHRFVCEEHVQTSRSDPAVDAADDASSPVAERVEATRDESVTLDFEVKADRKMYLPLLKR